MVSSRKIIRVTHGPSGTRLAEGPMGWGIMSFEGNLYVSRKYLLTKGFKPSFVPGVCFYKFLYVWMDLELDDGTRVRNLAWLYWLPNPLLPFIWYRIALPRSHPDILVEEITSKLDKSEVRTAIDTHRRWHLRGKGSR